MVQRPKAEVRAAILRAAGEAFANGGLERTSLADVVARAGTSVGNLYKYFASKDQLFAEFMPPDFPEQLKRRVRDQVLALSGETDVFALAADHPYRRASEDLVAFTIAHRERVVFLLLRAEGTTHQGFAGELTRLLVELALRYARQAYPTFASTAANTRALTRIYGAFTASLGQILTEERSERAVAAALATHSTYHLSGLKAVFERPAREAST